MKFKLIFNYVFILYNLLFFQISLQFIRYTLLKFKCLTIKFIILKYFTNFYFNKCHYYEQNIPIANNNIEGSSHFTLVINNKQLYKSTIKFYVNLGFNIEPLQSKYNYKHEFEATTWEDNHYTKTLVEYSEDEHTIFDEETWLVLENENGKVKLRIVENLRKDFAVADFSQVSDEKLHKLLLEHTSLENAYMTFSAKLDVIIFLKISKAYLL